MSLIDNKKNHHPWPAVVSSDVMRHTVDLKANVLMFTGQVKGKTILPMPAQADSIEEAANREQE